MVANEEHEQTGVGQPEAAGAQTPEDSIAQAERERDEMKAIAQRAQADLVNYKRRVEEERQMEAHKAFTRMVENLFIPMVDHIWATVVNLPADADPNLYGGIKIAFDDMVQRLARQGVAILDPAEGEVFDPTRHEALAFIPSTVQPEGTVIKTLQPGYHSADRVLRAAQVVVSQGAAAGDDTTTNDEQAKE